MSKKKAYLIGIKGVAMTSLAVYLKEKGYEVTGSDVEDEFPTDEILKQYKIKVIPGFSAENINSSYDVVVVTGAHGGMTNPQAQQAIKLQIPTYMHGEFLGRLMKDKFGISVSGCHGKTTTSSIIAFLLSKAKLKPSYLIGTSRINGLGPAGHAGTGNTFIAEADEYMTCPQTDPTPRFLWQEPKILVITNIEFDHPDAYKDIDSVKEAYLTFIGKLKDDAVVIACIDNRSVLDILPKIKQQVITYGFSPQADFQIYRCYFGENAGFMKVKHKGMDLGEYMLSIPGKHNMLNALAALIAAGEAGVGRDNLKKYIKFYTGCRRRFEKVGQIGNVLLYDDYAHHPSEIAATLSAAREWFAERRIIAVFQPHTFSRTKALMGDFAKSFSAADIALICPIYPSAREKFDGSVSSQALVLEVNRHKRNAVFVKDKQQLMKFLGENVKSGDLILTMGAGDIYTWHDDFKVLLREKLK